MVRTVLAVVVSVGLAVAFGVVCIGSVLSLISSVALGVSGLTTLDVGPPTSAKIKIN